MYWAELPILWEQNTSDHLVANCYAVLELKSLPLPMHHLPALIELDRLDLLALFDSENAVTVLDVVVRLLAQRGYLLLSRELVPFLRIYTPMNPLSEILAGLGLMLVSLLAVRQAPMK